MNTRHRSILLGTAHLLTAVVIGSAGCAIGADPAGEDDDDATGGGGPNACGMDCSSIQTDPCNRGVCDEETGNCAVAPAENGTECDDNVFCTAIDTCNEGYCVGAGVTDCELQVSPCEEVVCNEAAQTCTTVPKAEGANCDSPNLCEINATCSGGVCGGGEPRNCLYAPVPSDCHVSECNPTNGQCEARTGNNGGECADPADPCQVSGTCNAGTCENTSPKDCSSETDPATCTIGVCNATSGACEGQAGQDDDPCDDLDGCSTGDACQSGVCTPTGEILNCVNDDGCCPTACNIGSDNDCSPYGTYCDWPIDVTSVSFPHGVTGVFDDDPAVTTSCTDNTPTNAVWHSYRASTTAQHTILVENATTTNAWMRLAVFNGTGCSPLGSEIDCVQNSSKTVTITVSMTSGQWYRIFTYTDGLTYTMVDPQITITPQ